jgi:glycosyltransferase involved in cell wall biosynthesis
VTVKGSGRRRRVLHVIQNLNYGGMERLLADLVLHDDPAEFENHVLVLQYLGRFAEGLEGHATVHASVPLPRWTMLWPAPLARQIKAIAPDVVHLHSGVWYKASLAARMAGVPWVIHTEHGRRSPDPWVIRRIDGLAARRTDVVVAVSEKLAADLARHVVGRGTTIVTIPNGVDTSVYAPRPDSGRIRRELGIDAGAPIIGSIGRLEPIKGYDVMLEAFALLAKRRPDGAPGPHLVVAGDGSTRPALVERAGVLGLAGSAHFPGWRDDVHDLLSAFTLFTMSSRSEGTSVSLLEAMSSGLCPIVTAVGGNPAVLGPALAHRLLPSENPEALAAAWADALENPDARGRDAATARARVEASFGLGAMVRRYEALYRQGPG